MVKPVQKCVLLHFIYITECADETYGQGCNETCGQCSGKPCNKTNGTCHGGCQIGYDYRKDSTCKTGMVLVVLRTKKLTFEFP